MTVKADAKKRVVVPGARPGDIFVCEEQDENHFLLVRLTPPPVRAKKTKAEFRRALKSSKLKFDVTWEELRAMTREP
jgi:hypothetical protein